jgi:DNA-binding beta-propeller fold protein YncE
MNRTGRLAGGRMGALVVAALVASCTLVSPAFADDREQNRSGLPKGSLWVVNRDLGELVVFDAQNGNVIAKLPVGAGAHDICISEKARKAYVTAETINAVTAVDTKTLDVESIAIAPLPHHIEPSPDGRTVYVSLASHTPTVGAPQVAAIDTDDHSVTYITTSANPNARSHGPRLSPDGKTLYVAHDIGDEVTAVDLRNGTIDFSVAPIVRAEEVIRGRFGDLLWASSRGDGTVKRIDLETNTITGSVAVGVQPESVMLAPSERTLVASLRGTPATLAFVDTINLTLRGTLPIAGAGTFGDLAVITKDGRFVFATFDAGSTGTGGVAVVDVRERKVVATYQYPGTGRPHGIWYSKKKPY